MDQDAKSPKFQGYAPESGLIGIRGRQRLATALRVGAIDEHIIDLAHSGAGDHRVHARFDTASTVLSRSVAPGRECVPPAAGNMAQLLIYELDPREHGGVAAVADRILAHRSRSPCRRSEGARPREFQRCAYRSPPAGSQSGRLRAARSRSILKRAGNPRHARYAAAHPRGSRTIKPRRAVFRHLLPPASGANCFSQRPFRN